MASASAMHGHSTEKCPEEVIELLKLVVFLILIGLPILGRRTILLWTESIVVCFLFCVDKRGVGIRDFFEYFFGACMLESVPSY